MLSYQLRPSQVAVGRTDATRRLCGRYDRLSGRSNRDGWADHRGRLPSVPGSPATPLLSSFTSSLLTPHSSYHTLRDQASRPKSHVIGYILLIQSARQTPDVILARLIEMVSLIYLRVTSIPASQYTWFSCSTWYLIMVGGASQVFFG